MTAEQKVKQAELRARCLERYVKGSHGSVVEGYSILVGLSAYPPEIGRGKTAEEAWADAWNRIQAGGANG